MSRKRFTGRLTGSTFFDAVRKSFRDDGHYGPTLREYFRAGADVFLQEEFNISPLLSDITGIFSSFDRALKVMNNLITNEGKRRRKHFAYSFRSSLQKQNADGFTLCSLSDENSYGDPVNGPRVYGGCILGCKLEYNNVGWPAQFYAQMEYNYSFTAFQREHAKLLTILDLLGVNLNPAIIWNAIPWSFVVDWVAKCGNYLDNHKVLNMEPRTNITRYMWSWKVRRHRNGILKSYQTAANCPQIHVVLPTVYEEAYRRGVDMPVSDPLVLSGISAHELSLGVALAIPSAKRRKRV
jgi:hypothetical protein